MTIEEIVEREGAKHYSVPNAAPDLVKRQVRNQRNDARAFGLAIAKAVVEEGSKRVSHFKDGGRSGGLFVGSDEKHDPEYCRRMAGGCALLALAAQGPGGGKAGKAKDENWI